MIGSLLLLFSGAGCVSVPLTAAGSLLGFAGTAASTGTEVYSLGKLDFCVMATFDECRCAAVATSKDLGLHLRRTEWVRKRTDECVIRLDDDRDAEIDVHIDRRTERMCQCRVDVGLFGSETTAKLVVGRVRVHLPRGGG